MIPTKIKFLIDKYCMGVVPSDEQMDEIMDMVTMLDADSAAVSEYIKEMINGPTKQEREKAELQFKIDYERRKKEKAELAEIEQQKKQEQLRKEKRKRLMMAPIMPFVWIFKFLGLFLALVWNLFKNIRFDKIVKLLGRFLSAMLGLLTSIRLWFYLITVSFVAFFALIGILDFSIVEPVWPLLIMLLALGIGIYWLCNDKGEYCKVAFMCTILSMLCTFIIPAMFFLNLGKASEVSVLLLVIIVLWNGLVSLMCISATLNDNLSYASHTISTVILFIFPFLQSLGMLTWNNGTVIAASLVSAFIAVFITEGLS